MRSNADQVRDAARDIFTAWGDQLAGGGGTRLGGCPRTDGSPGGVVMKRYALITSIFFTLVTFGSTQMSMAQDKSKRPSPPASAECAFSDGKTVKVDYSSPRAKGRKMFGELVPYGQVWRTGANEATTFVINTDLNVGGKDVSAGAYTIFTIPEADKWTLVISKETGEWGTAYPGEGEDLARVPMSVSKTSAPVENFTIGFDQTGSRCTMYMDWGNTRASVDARSSQARRAGGTLFKTKCAVCHGQDGQGEVPMGKRFGVRNLSSADVQDQSDAQLTEIIMKGKNKMPAYGGGSTGGLTNQQLGELVAYIREHESPTTTTTATPPPTAITSDRLADFADAQILADIKPRLGTCDGKIKVTGVRVVDKMVDGKQGVALVEITADWVATAKNAWDELDSIASSMDCPGFTYKGGHNQKVQKKLLYVKWESGWRFERVAD